MQQFAANFAAQVAARQAATLAPATGTTGEAGPVAPIVPPIASELNGLALAWAVFKDWKLRSLFTRKAG